VFGGPVVAQPNLGIQGARLQGQIQLPLRGLWFCCCLPPVTSTLVCAQKCKDASFCARNRGQKGTKYSVVPDSIKVDGATLSAVLQKDGGQQQFNLTLKAYGPVMRLLVDELPSQGRYQVPDILMPGVEQQQTPWEQQGVVKGSWVGTVGGVKVKLTLASFTMEVSVGGKVAYIFNYRSMFQFEHRRQKQVGASSPGHPCNWVEVLPGSGQIMVVCRQSQPPAVAMWPAAAAGLACASWQVVAALVRCPTPASRPIPASSPQPCLHSPTAPQHLHHPPTHPPTHPYTHHHAPTPNTTGGRPGGLVGGDVQRPHRQQEEGP
jgi:hypothetical protein